MIKKPNDLLSKRFRMVADLIEEGVVIAVASHLNLADKELEVNLVRVASRAVEVDHLKSILQCSDVSHKRASQC